MYSDVMKTIQWAHRPHHLNGFVLTCRLWTSTRKLCIYFVYKNCTRCIQLMYTKCIQNLSKMYTTFWQNFFIHFVYKIRRTMPAKFCIQNVYKSLSKCGINFVYKHFVYILYTKVCRNVGYILYSNILYTFSIATFCIQNAYKRLSKVGTHFV